MGYFYKFRVRMSSITNPHHWLDYLTLFSEQEKPVATGTAAHLSHKCIAAFWNSCQVHRLALQKHPLLSRSNSITKSSERQQSLLMVDPILFSSIYWCRRCLPIKTWIINRPVGFLSGRKSRSSYHLPAFWGATRPEKPEQFQMLSQT